VLAARQINEQQQLRLLNNNNNNNNNNVKNKVPNSRDSGSSEKVHVDANMQVHCVCVPSVVRIIDLIRIAFKASTYGEELSSFGIAAPREWVLKIEDGGQIIYNF